MDPDKLKLENISKLFEYEKMCRELDSCYDIDKMRDLCKCYIKLYFALEEMMQNINILSED
jgi:hypothetical protein